MYMLYLSFLVTLCWLMFTWKFCVHSLICWKNIILLGMLQISWIFLKYVTCTLTVIVVACLLFPFSLIKRKFAERNYQQQTPQFEGGNMNLVLFGFETTGDYMLALNSIYYINQFLIENPNAEGIDGVLVIFQYNSISSSSLTQSLHLFILYQFLIAWINSIVCIFLLA